MSNRFGSRAHQGGIPAFSDVANWMPTSLVRSIQRGTITIAGGASSNTGAITAVVLTNSRLKFLGASSTALQQNDNGYCRIALTNTTTITATRGNTPAGTVTANFELIEYWPGVIKSVQRGAITVAADPTDDTITTVNTGKTEVDYLGFLFDTTAAELTTQCRVALLNATTVRANETTLGGVVGYQVIEWY